MALYLIGDVQGCDAALGRLLEKVDFSPSRDTLFLLGDLVNRGPDSAGVLRRLIGHDGSAQCLLGNHDLHLLAVALGGDRKARTGDTLAPLLASTDRDTLIDWLSHQRLALQAPGLLMVHAGVLPQWDAAQVLALAGEVETALRGPGRVDFLAHLYGNEPARWDPSLTGHARLRVVVNALTRLRLCTADGTMDLKASGGPGSAPPGLLPWFEVPGRRTAGTTVAFGHWSTLGFMQRPGLLSLDTGCVWGGCLTAVEWRGPGQTGAGLPIQVKCERERQPGE